MSCRSCAAARHALAMAARSAVSGDLAGAARAASEAVTHLGDKAQSEAQRVRALLTRRS